MDFLQCEDIECLFHLETSYPADMNTVQAVYAIGAAVSRARTQLCSNTTSTHPVDGLCSGQHSRVELQQILNMHLRQSVTERADGAANENFQFTESGAGNVATEILNFRRKANERSRSMKNIYFERVGIWSEDKLSRGILPMLAYRDSGAEVSVSVLTSQCRSSNCCSTPFSKDRLTIEPVGRGKSPALYIAATFGIHVASANPLECGVEINREGMEQLEAFLWAVDQQQHLIERSNDVEQPKSSLRLVVKQPQQSSAVLETVMSSVWSVAVGLHNFLDRHCAQHIWNGNDHIGSWIRFKGLKLTSKLPKLITDCRSPLNCTPCGTSSRHSLLNRPALYHNLQYPYAAVLGGLALLGAFLTILTTVYFLVAAVLPNNNATGGTSVLGHFILLGLMLLFTANLSFVLLPTEVTCGVRRFQPGLAYAIIFAGMLLKMFTTWRYGSTYDRDRDALSRPAGLIVAALVISLVQILLSGGWLTIVPPRVHTFTSPNEPPVWRCYPIGNFEAHLLLSLSYVFLLLTVTAAFALLCYLSSRKQLLEEWTGEARWILVACLVVAVVLT